MYLSPPPPVLTRLLVISGLIFLCPFFGAGQGTVTFGSVTYNSGNGLYGVDVFYNNPIANLAGLNIDIQFENIDSDDIQISSNETDGSTSSEVSATVITGGYIRVEFNDDGSAPISLGANDLVGTIYFSILSGKTVAIENVGSRIKLKNHRPYTNIVTKLGSRAYSSIEMIESSSFPDLGGVGVTTDVAKSHRNLFSIGVSPNLVSSIFELSISSKITHQVKADLKIIQGSTGALISTRPILLYPGNNVFFIDELNGKPDGLYVYTLAIDGEEGGLASGKFIKSK